jgi:hypothetical protein
MSDIPCRSGDCKQEAEFEVMVFPKKPGRGEYTEDWTGCFCRQHLNRVLAHRIVLMDDEQFMTIQRLEAKRRWLKRAHAPKVKGLT